MPKSRPPYAAATLEAPGYRGCDKMRTQPFCVSGHDAQPSAMLSSSQLNAVAW